MRTILSIITLVLAAPLLDAAVPSVDDVVANAREFLGGDAALNSIESIRYEAEFSTVEGETGKLTIIFQKPMQQRIEIVRDEVGEVTALNDFDAWRKVYDVNDESRWSLALLDSAKIRELQANTWENLNFFHGIEQRRGWIENKGLSEIDGRDAVQLAFHHPRNLTFIRFFDVETGRLMMTRTHDGSEIRETGEIRVNGILFPEKITMSRDGVIINEIRFVDVGLNERFDNSVFDVPSLAR